MKVSRDSGTILQANNPVADLRTRQQKRRDNEAFTQKSGAALAL